MLSAERKLKIAEIVCKNGGIKTSALSDMFYVSEMTILRDLAELEQQGILKRVYGGAVVENDSTREISSILRKRIHSTEKNVIAEKAIKLISNGESLFLDGSTTVLSFAKRISAKKEITVITHSLDIINELKNNNDIKIICSGGEFQETTLCFVGPRTEIFLKEFYADKAFISPAGISIKAGLTVENPLQASVKRTMLENSSQKIVLIDSSKFDKISLSRVFNIDDVNIIVTDKKPDKKYIDYFKKNGVEIIY
ncbi:MAG: DeoR/GlpR transcriptional regulator [Actinobacteria bacterium]|nr:DeoR/GlpR transcriptional regulator [Actinomycetota bacterium]